MGRRAFRLKPTCRISGFTTMWVSPAGSLLVYALTGSLPATVGVPRG